MRRIAWLTDQHGIFVDRDAWELALKLVQDFAPHVVPIGSDDIDFYTLSRFDKNPKRRMTVQDEIDFQIQRYEELKDAVDPYWNSSRKPSSWEPILHPVVLGNHNIRFFKKLWSDPSFFGVRNLAYPELFQFDRFGFDWKDDPWNYQSNIDWYASDKLVFTHGERVSKYPGYSVKNQMNDRFFDASLVMGHCHRGAKIHIPKPDGTQLFGVEGFCLCDLNPEYDPHANWTQGIVFITEHNSGFYEVEPIQFHRLDRLYAYWRGAEYSVPIT